MRRKTKRIFIEACLAFCAISLLTYFTLPNFLKAQNINDKDHFPDPVFRSVVRWLMDVQEDERFSGYSTRRYTGQLCLLGDIKDLSGLEYFPSIDKFELISGTIKKLDLSRNTGLTEVRISHTPVEEIVLPRNNRIRTLYLADTQIEKLNASRCSKLTHLICYKGNLSEIDISRNSQLIALDCSFNKLKEIDLSKNPRLQEVNCSNNRIERIVLCGEQNNMDCDCRHNQLTDLQPFLQIAQWVLLDVRFNRLGTDDLENVRVLQSRFDGEKIADVKLTGVKREKKFSYSPQIDIDPYE